MSGWSSADTEPGYYGAPIVKPAPWKDEIAAYFFTGGLAGASSVLAAAARVMGQPGLARHARHWALAGLAPSPVLLVVDLGRPERFANMLRVLKPTSPMSVGSWLLAFYGPAATAAAVLADLHRASRAAAVLDLVAAGLGSGLATYTAVLVADTATPVWHEGRRTLPLLFAASAAASAGAAATISAPLSEAGPARVLAVVATLAETAVGRTMEGQLGPLAIARCRGRAGAYRRASEVLSVTGALFLVLGRRRRAVSALGAIAVLGSALSQRLCVLESGKESARDPAQTLLAQATS
jgi:formate-dependent nitrite reductase membrane component NrfD